MTRQPTEGRCIRARWIARHLSTIGVSYHGADPVPRVELAEVSGMLLELADLREEKARNWRPPPSLWQRIRARFGR